MSIPESNLDPKNEITIYNSSFQSETESHVSNNEQDLLLLFGEGLECLQDDPNTAFHIFCHFKNFYHLMGLSLLA